MVIASYYNSLWCIFLGCSRSVVRDVVFMIATSSNIGESRFQVVREMIENITINLKVNSPESLIGLITFDYVTRLEFNISKHTDLSTLIPAINPGLPYYANSDTTNTASALSFLLSGSVEGGFLQLRDNTAKVAIVIYDGYRSRSSSLQSAAKSLHAANIFDVYAVGIGSNRYYDLFLIASKLSFVFATSTLTLRAQALEYHVINQLCSSK